MSRSTPLILGIFAALAVSVFAMVLVPQAQIGGLQPQVDKDEEGKITDIYPVDHVRFGARVYAGEGCVYCHSQQVRDAQYGPDQDRGWGPRRTVARDYLYDPVPFLGSQRLGPDLTNIGAKTWRNEPEGDTLRPLHRDAAWQYLHLYKPTAVISESNMPPYRHLFEKRKIGAGRSIDALPESEVAVEQGYEIVPTERAQKLVAYLFSLDRTHAVKEVKSTPAAAAVAAQ